MDFDNKRGLRVLIVLQNGKLQVSVGDPDMLRVDFFAVAVCRQPREGEPSCSSCQLFRGVVQFLDGVEAYPMVVNVNLIETFVPDVIFSVRGFFCQNIIQNGQCPAA